MPDQTITPERLTEILADHILWLRSQGGKRANLRRSDLSSANLSDADLRGADLSGANLSDANLSGANLSGADLSGADLSGADLSGADLSGADLSSADLSSANLSSANLRRTNFDPAILNLQRSFVRSCPPVRTGGRIVYRSAMSLHVGLTEYEPGKTYVAPVLSFDAATECHPGIYAASLAWMKENYAVHKLVRCYVRDGDWVITSKGCIRCKRLRVLDYVE